MTEQLDATIIIKQIKPPIVRRQIEPNDMTDCVLLSSMRWINRTGKRNEYLEIKENSNEQNFQFSITGIHINFTYFVFLDDVWRSQADWIQYMITFLLPTYGNSEHLIAEEQQSISIYTIKTTNFTATK